jgi:hypothetical protein
MPELGNWGDGEMAEMQDRLFFISAISAISDISDIRIGQ